MYVITPFLMVEKLKKCWLLICENAVVTVKSDVNYLLACLIMGKYYQPDDVFLSGPPIRDITPRTRLFPRGKSKRNRRACGSPRRVFITVVVNQTY